MAPPGGFDYVFRSMKSQITAGLLVLGGSLFLSVPPCAAEPQFLVQWDGAYLERKTGGEKLNLTGETALTDPDQQPLGVGFLSNEDVPLSPAVAGYDTTKPSALFYGLLEINNPSKAQTQDIASPIRSLNTVVANYGKNMINLAASDPAEGGTAQVRGLVFWKLKDSPLETARGGVPGSAIQSLAVEVSKINSKLSEFRFAVQNEGRWFLSESQGTRTGWTTIHDTTWGEWPVKGEFPLPPIPDQFPVSSADFKSITALGIAFTGVSEAPGANAVFGFKAFYAEANPDVLPK